MNILYIAYSCSPVTGSEDRVGWNVAVEMSKIHRVHVITKIEHKEAIECYLHQYPIDNICFHYVDIPNIYKRFFKGFLYSGRLNIWHNIALPLAEEICRKYKIEIIHQLTPVELRAIGDYGRIKNVKYICGPLGGGEYVPKGLSFYKKGHYSVELLRDLMNRWYRLWFKITGRLERCDYFIYANEETKQYMGCGNHVEAEIAVDSICPKKKSSFNKNCVFLMAGRMIYRKGLDFLFDTIERIPEDKLFEVRIIGDGPEMHKLKSRWDKSKKLQKHIVFMGRIPFLEMKNEYDKADVFLMPSIRETTGSVLFEAMANGIPIIAINHFGSGLLLNDDLGWTFDGNTKEEFIESFANAIVDCIDHPEEVRRKGNNMLLAAKKYTWNIKVQHYETIYKKIRNENCTSKL